MDGPGLTPLAGGLSGETFLAGSAGERVVRICAGRALAASGDLHAVV
jgi:hypothetical protein